jgi:hypothetical protein
VFGEFRNSPIGISGRRVRGVAWPPVDQGIRLVEGFRALPDAGTAATYPVAPTGDTSVPVAGAAAKYDRQRLAVSCPTLRC